MSLVGFLIGILETTAIYATKYLLNKNNYFKLYYLFNGLRVFLYRVQIDSTKNKIKSKSRFEEID